MKSISRLASVLCVLLLAATSWAMPIDYTGTTTLDLTTLRFSGILTTYTPTLQFSQSIVQIPDSSEGAATQAPFTINHGPIVEQNVSTSLEGGGSASAFNDATRMTETVHYTGPLFVSSEVDQQGSLVASQAGALTVTVEYTMSHSGVPTDLRQFFVSGGPTLFVGNNFDSAQHCGCQWDAVWPVERHSILHSGRASGLLRGYESNRSGSARARHVLADRARDGRTRGPHGLATNAASVNSTHSVITDGGSSIGRPF